MVEAQENKINETKEAEYAEAKSRHELLKIQNEQEYAKRQKARRAEIAKKQLALLESKRQQNKEDKAKLQELQEQLSRIRAEKLKAKAAAEKAEQEHKEALARRKRIAKQFGIGTALAVGVVGTLMAAKETHDMTYPGAGGNNAQVSAYHAETTICSLPRQSGQSQATATRPTGHRWILQNRPPGPGILRMS